MKCWFHGEPYVQVESIRVKGLYCICVFHLNEEADGGISSPTPNAPTLAELIARRGLSHLPIGFYLAYSIHISISFHLSLIDSLNKKSMKTLCAVIFSIFIFVNLISFETKV